MKQALRSALVKSRRAVGDDGSALGRKSNVSAIIERKRSEAELKGLLKEVIDLKAALDRADITERKRSEELLRASEERYRTLFEDTPDGILIANPANYYLDANASACRMLGYSRDELIGLHARDIVSGTEMQHIGTALSAITEKSDYHRECQFRRKDGSFFPANVIATLMPDGNLLGRIRDITEERRTQTALGASELRYRRLFETAKDGILILDAQTGMVVDVNPFLITTLGFSHEEFLSKAIWELGFFKDIWANAEKFAELKDKEYVRYEHLPLETSDGQRIEVEFVSNVYLVNGSKVIQCNVRDVTARREAEEALRQLNANLEQRVEERTAELDRFFTISLDILCIANADGYFKRISPAFTQTLGWSVEEILARPFLDFVHPDDVAATLRVVERLVVAGEKVFQFENRYQHKDGSWRVLSWKAAPQPGGMMYCAARDVTEQHEHDQRLHQQAALLDLALDAILVRDLEDRVTYLNRGAEQLYGISREQALGHVTHTLLQTTFPQPLADIMAEVDAKGRWQGELLHGTRDGRRVTVESYWVKQTDVQGRKLAVLEINRDITARKQAEAEIRKLNTDLQQRAAQLEAANKELESFSYSVSHDLRAPLRHIEGYVELVVRHAGETLDEKSRGHLQTVSESVAEMGQLIDDLLDFSRMGQVEMQQTTINLDQLVGETIAGLEREIHGRDIVWKRGPLPPVQADVALMKQVFVNLISNAVKYTRPRDPAEVEIGCAREENGEAVLFVRDNGVGFDMKYADKLFGVFQRLHHADEFEGTGVGLANVQRIIARHGGRIWAEAALNGGATFFFTLTKSQNRRKDEP